MIPAQPLATASSLKAKLGLLVGVSVVGAAIVFAIGAAAGVPWWATVPVTIAVALATTQWFARGMTVPLRSMTAATQAMASGDYSVRVPEGTPDEVGQLARAFNTMAADLGATDAQRRELVATVSHELRTPLAGQRALLENLVDGVVTADDAALTVALHQAERLSNLVEDLLDLSRIDGGARSLELTEVPIRPLLEAAAAESMAGSHSQISPQIVVQPPGLSVRADHSRLAQVVGNLLDNAIRYAAHGQIVARATQTPAGWQLDILDDGPGIAAQDADRIFTRFGTGPTAGGNTGLGLAIARWICELHGGSIDLVAPGDRLPGDPDGAHLRARFPREPPIRTMAETSAEVQPLTAARLHPAPQESEMPTTAPIPAIATRQYAPANRSLLESIFGDTWPERDSRPRPRLLGGVIAVALFAALTLPFAPLGLAVALTLLASGLLIGAVSPRRREPSVLASGAIAVALGSMLVLRDSGGVAFWSVAFAILLSMTAITGASRASGIVVTFLAWPLSALRGLPWLGRTLGVVRRHSSLWRIVQTAVASIVALLVFGALFTTADAVLGSWVSAALPELAWSSVVFRTFVFLFVFGVLLTAVYLAVNPADVDRPIFPAHARARSSWEWAIPLGVVIATFVAFLAAQATALFAGHDYVTQTTGMTYAGYVHQGFAQLTVATGFTLVVIALTLLRADLDDTRQALMLRVAVTVLGLLTLAVVASAMWRMNLYQEAYGFTRLRLLVDGFEIWVALIVALVVIGVLRLRLGWLPRAAVFSAAVFALVFGVMNPDAWVARQNLDRYAASGSVDTAYLASLSADAAPVIAASSLPDEQKACIFAAHRNRQFVTADDGQLGVAPDPWNGWNYSRWRASEILGSYATTDGTACALGDYRR